MSFVLLGILNSQAAGAGGAGAYDLLETTILDSSASSVTFDNLDAYSNYSHLQIRASLQSTSGFNRNLKLYLNNDTSASYRTHRLAGFGTGTESRDVGGSGAVEMAVGLVASNNGDGTNVFAPSIVDILDFSNTNKNTTVRGFSGVDVDTALAVALYSGLYINTAAITQITLKSDTDDLTTGSRISLYGIG